MKFKELIKGIDLFPHVNFANLGKIELFRKYKIKLSEALMTDIQYRVYLIEKYGTNCWADHLITELVEVRSLRKNIKLQQTEYPYLENDESEDKSSLAIWEDEGGAIEL